MGNINTMAGVGVEIEHAKSIVGAINTAQVSAGSSAADAALVAGDAVYLASVGGSTGVILSDKVPVGSEIRIYNGSATALLLYPNSGATINGAASQAIAANTGAIVARLSDTIWGAVASA